MYWDWCAQATRGILEDKAALVSREYVENRLGDAMQHPQDCIVRSHIGDTVSLNSFAVVLKEAKHAALLMELPSRVVSDDGYGQRGLEVPEFDLLAADNHIPERVFRAKKTGHSPHASPHFASHQITPKTSRYTRCSMSRLPNVAINGRTRSSGQLGRWWYSISPCRNNECVRRFTVFAFNQRS